MSTIAEACQSLGTKELRKEELVGTKRQLSTRPEVIRTGSHKYTEDSKKFRTSKSAYIE